MAGKKKQSSVLIQEYMLPIRKILWSYFLESNPNIMIPLVLALASLFRATPSVLIMWSCKLKLDEEKSKHASLAQQKWFWPNIFAQFAEAGKRPSKA
jgi:hypothetical protein